MEKEKIIIELLFRRDGKETDVEVPLDITANELIIGLNDSFALGMNTEDLSLCYLRSENPIALLKGSKTLREFELHNGTVINIC